MLSLASAHPYDTKRPVGGWSSPSPEGDTLASAAEVKHHIYRGFDLNRLAVQIVRLISPSLHCFQCRLGQHGWPTNHTQILNGALLGNGCLQHHRTRNAGRASNRRVGW